MLWHETTPPPLDSDPGLEYVPPPNPPKPLTFVLGRLLLYPVTLCYDWQMGSIPLVQSPADPRVLLTATSFLVLILLSWAALRQHCHAPLWGVLLLTVPFLPASNLFIRVGFVVAERVLYLPRWVWVAVKPVYPSRVVAGRVPRWVWVAQMVVGKPVLRWVWLRCGSKCDSLQHGLVCAGGDGTKMCVPALACTAPPFPLPPPPPPRCLRRTHSQQEHRLEDTPHPLRVCVHTHREHHTLFIHAYMHAHTLGTWHTLHTIIL